MLQAWFHIFPMNHPQVHATAWLAEVCVEKGKKQTNGNTYLICLHACLSTKSQLFQLQDNNTARVDPIALPLKYRLSIATFVATVQNKVWRAEWKCDNLPCISILFTTCTFCRSIFLRTECRQSIFPQILSKHLFQSWWSQNLLRSYCTFQNETIHLWFNAFVLAVCSLNTRVMHPWIARWRKQSSEYTKIFWVLMGTIRTLQMDKYSMYPRFTKPVTKDQDIMWFYPKELNLKYISLTLNCKSTFSPLIFFISPLYSLPSVHLRDLHLDSRAVVA